MFGIVYCENVFCEKLSLRILIGSQMFGIIFIFL